MKRFALIFITFAILLPSHGAHADIDPAKLAPLTPAQIEQFKAEFQDWKKKAKWSLQDPVQSLEILSDSAIRSVRLTSPVHALRLLYSEKQMKSTSSGSEVYSQGAALREIIGVETSGGFDILKDTGYFQPECDTEDFHHDLLQPIVLDKKALLAFTQTVHRLGCAGAEGEEKKSLLLLDPDQKYRQLLEVPLLKKSDSKIQMLATFSGSGGVGGGKDDVSSWYGLRVDRTAFKSARTPAVISHETFAWNQAKNQLELKKN